ncbi:MAG: hypothetical protein K9I85_03290 [Saprospiraceae bacterium]|nr:hypothetical protein [Saprospiraceae bacterium]
MQTTPLFPHTYRKIGWLLFLPGLALGIPSVFMEWTPAAFNWRIPALVADQIFNSDRTWFVMIKNNLIDELASLFMIIGALLICFSREVHEDEYITQIRLNALVWSVYINYALLAVAILFIYEMNFFYVMIFNFFTLLVIFYIRFRWLLVKSKKPAVDA